MATREALEAAARVGSMAHVAVTQIATRAAREVWELWVRWRRQPRRWHRAATKAVRLYRGQAREIALSGERLRRALVTGSTWGPESSTGELRNDFEGLVRQYAPQALRSSKNGRYGGALGAIPDVPVREDKLEALERLLKAEEARADAEIGARLAKLQEAVDDEFRQASMEGQVKGTVSSGVMAGSRGAHQQIGRADSKVLGWVRVHEPVGGEAPCPFCALLLSQGMVYKTAKAAGGRRGALYRFHNHCRCHAEPVYRGQDYNTDPRFEENRAWRKLYDSQFKKLPTSERYRAWRNHLDLKAGRISKERKMRKK